MHNIKIKLTNGSSTNGIVEVDGNILNCRRVEFTADIHSKPTLVLEIVPNNIEIEAEAFILEDITSVGDEWRKYKKYERR